MNAAVQFGDFVLDARECRLTRHGQPVALSPRPFDLLVALVRHRGQLVTREQLLRDVWQGVVVEQSSLNAAMSLLRQALGDQAGLIIETIPARGYRFVAPVAEVTAPSIPPVPPVADAAAPVCRVAIVDDHAIVRVGVRALLERTGRYRVVGEAGTVHEAHDMVRTTRPDVLVLDLMIGGDGSLDHIAEWRAVVPGLRVVMLSMHDEDAHARQALAAGAHGYVMKGEMVDELEAAIAGVTAGDVWVSARLSRAMVKDALEGRSLLP